MLTSNPPRARRALTLAAILVLCAAHLAPAARCQDVLAYSPLAWTDLQFYSGYAGLNVTLVDEAAWTLLTTAQFASYDMIWIGSTMTGATPPYDTLFATRMTWSPAITGRAVSMGLDPQAHPNPGAMQFVDDCATWLLAGGGTGLYLGTDAGAVGMSFMDQFGLAGCTPVNCFNQETVIITVPAHPTMAGSTSGSLSGWGQSTHARFTSVPPDWLTVATGPAGEPVVVVTEGAPACNFTAPMPGSLVTDEVTCTLDGDDPQGDPVAISFEFSTDMGMTWSLATPAASSPLANPTPGVATPFAALTFIWDSATDMVGVASVTTTTLRATCSDGLAAGSCTLSIDVDNTLLCNRICGDCNLNAIGPDILDALAAAQIAAGLFVPTPEQEACCDVNSSMSVEVLDALLIAQSAAGLGVVLICL